MSNFSRSDIKQFFQDTARERLNESSIRDEFRGVARSKTIDNPPQGDHMWTEILSGVEGGEGEMDMPNLFDDGLVMERKKIRQMIIQLLKEHA